MWASAEQRFLSPSPQAERGLGGEVADNANPTPNPSPLAGRGQTAAAIHHELGGYATRLSFAARDLRQAATSAERILWERLRSRRLNNAKFRRQHPLGPNYIVDFYCAEKRLAIELDGAVHDAPAAAWRDGIRQRQIQFAGVRLLRFRNDEIVDSLEDVLTVIAEALSTTDGPEEYWLPADQLSVGSLVVADEAGGTEPVELVQAVFVNETLFDLSVEEDHSFITSGGVARS